ncbi:MAG: CRISPR-associated RAMP protein Csx7 [candidate division KSB1 bacterium]|nr:CRISPR-associated RAMP protein Csx7 [candidate division KSB1 bacterium]MDZ7365943.1 CRISPR-associated RAMP protein Csx7 [candidate division KSB1 bacterium]MDZ7403823.1 CRISPR-associated RAMP protein Csx7 [candidate division KSB1 bacterium]
MLKQLLNECLIDLHIKTDGPVLIKSGLAQISGPDMAWVRTFYNGKEQIYLPGSSLKGVMRSHAERIARTLNPKVIVACDPFGDKYSESRSCGACFDYQKDQKKREPESFEAYRDACLICKLFGSTYFAGRLAFADAYAVGEEPRPTQRDGVGIDRFTGGAAYGAKFELEVVTDAVFATTLHLRNFELWQLGLLGFLLQDLKDGLIRIGSGKSRGLGRVVGEVQKVTLHFLGESPKHDGQLKIAGVGARFDGKDYGMMKSDEVLVPYGGKVTTNLIRHTAVFPKDDFPWQIFAPLWVERARSFEDRLAGVRQGGKR